MLGAWVAGGVKERSKRVRFVGADGYFDSIAEVIRRATARVVLYYWNVDAVALAVLVASSGPRMGHVWSRIEVVHDESFGGRISRDMAQGFGFGTRSLHWGREDRRARDLVALMRSHSCVAIAVDGHGPYGEVGGAFARLMGKLDAVAVPVAVVASEYWSLPVRARIAVPRARSCVAAVAGRPISSVGISVNQLQSDLAAGLGEARGAAMRMLRLGEESHGGSARG